MKLYWRCTWIKKTLVGTCQDRDVTSDLCLKLSNNFRQWHIFAYVPTPGSSSNHIFTYGYTHNSICVHTSTDLCIYIWTMPMPMYTYFHILRMHTQRTCTLSCSNSIGERIWVARVGRLGQWRPLPRDLEQVHTKATATVIPLLLYPVAGATVDVPNVAYIRWRQLGTTIFLI